MSHRYMLRHIFPLFAASTVLAQSIQYQVPEKSWSANLGSHRAVVHVDAAGVARAHLEWRRRDPAPEKKGVIVANAATGEKLPETAVTGVSPERGDVIFRAPAAGDYVVYFLPGQPGGGSFPVAKYDPPVAPAGELTTPSVDAKVVRWEARTEHDRWNETEIIATKAECDAWLAKHPAPFAVFPESRDLSVRMFDFVPEVWLKRTAPPKFSARINEFYPFQLGVWAARGELKNVRVTFSDFATSAGGRVPGSALRCLQTSGTNWDGKPITRTIDIDAGRVQPLWCAMDIGANAAPGIYTGTAQVSAEGKAPQSVPLSFEITGPALADRGDSEPARLTKLRWLDSMIGQDDEPARPYTALQIEGKTIKLLGRSVTLGEDGMPQRITSYFHPGVTRIVQQPTEVLDAPMRFVVELADGKVLALAPSGFKFTKKATGVVEWSAVQKGGDLTLEVLGHIEADGQTELRTSLSAAKPVSVRDIRLEVPRTADTTSLVLGLGHYGGTSPAKIDWKWNVLKKHQDSIWLGTVNAGLRVQLRAENYVRPYVNIHYVRQQLNAPASWENGGLGGIRFERNDGQKQAPLVCFSGERTVEPGKPLHFDADLSITPFHTLNTREQWRDRLYHVGGVTEPAKISESGANVVNIHQGNALNPYINYPFLTAGKLDAYAKKIHDLKMRVKYYYTIRELTNWTPELFAAQAFGDELIARGNGNGHAWCEEHLGGKYWQAWAEPSTNDASILTRSMSRWNNLYLQGLDWLIKNAGCDGLYLDDISYDRTTMKRARKILDRAPELQARGGGLIDLHSWNEAHDGRAGYANCALIFMDSLPYVDRMWFGEGHHYDGAPEQTLAAISGIPFGLMGEMLEGGGNPWLGLTFGMTGRLGWGGRPQETWKVWDNFGVADAEFIGWWNPESPVRADSPDIKVTAWKKNGRTLLAVGNFGSKPALTKLTIDWKALGLDPAKASLYAPAMENFQPEALFRPGAPIPIASKRGFVFWVDEQKRADIAAESIALEKRAVLFEDRFTPKAAADWTVTAKNPEVIKTDGKGQVFLAPANTHAWVSRAVPQGASVIATQVRQDAGDKAQQWGPGLAVLWPDGKFLKVNRRTDGNFNVSINGEERLAGHGDRELPVTLAVAIDDKRVRVLALGEGAFQQEQELASLPRKDFPGAPTELRIGKMPNSLKPADNGDAGELGWSRFDWVRVLK